MGAHIPVVPNDRPVSPLEKATMRKVVWRLLPFLMFCYFMAFIDRVNVGFAALQMNRDLSFSSAVFGLGASLFFIAYFLFEVPSNIAMEKVGARYWIARIMITWGAISAGMAFVTGPTSFYVMRFLLGAAEAGFFPGVILYLTYWFPANYRARIVAIFMVAIPASSFVGSPLSGLLLGLDGFGGFKGWQWMFLLEGVVTVVLGFLCLFVLRDGPTQVSWLNEEQKGWLDGQISAERQISKAVHDVPIMKVLLNKYILAGSIIYGGSTGASACLSIWLPQILHSYGLTTFQTGLINSIPFGFAAVIMVLWGRSSDKRAERTWHTAIPLAAIAGSLALMFFEPNLVMAVGIFTIAISATYCVKGPFWALSTEWLSAKTAAVGIAQINAIGGLWSGFATYSLGVIKQNTGSYAMGLLPLVALTTAGALMVVLLSRRQQNVARAAAAATAA